MSASTAPVPPVMHSTAPVVRPRPAVPLTPCDTGPQSPATAAAAARGTPNTAAAAPAAPPALVRLQRAVAGTVQTLERRAGAGDSAVAGAVSAAAEAQAVFRSGLAPAERDVFDAHVAAAVLRSVCAVAEQLYAAAGDGDDARATADRLCGLVASALGRHSSSNFGGGSVAVPATLPCSASVPDLRKAGMGPLQQPQQSSPSASGTATPAHGRRRHLVTSGTLLPFLDDGKEKDSDDSGKKAKIQQLAGRPVLPFASELRMRARAKGGAAEREAESGNTSDSGGSKDRLGGFLSTLFKKGKRDDGGATSPRLDAVGSGDSTGAGDDGDSAAGAGAGAGGSGTSGESGESGSGSGTEEHDGPLIVVPTRKLVIGGDVPGEEDKTRREYIAEEIVLTEQSYTEGLRTVVECYEKPLAEAGIVDKETQHLLFGNISELLRLHRELYESLARKEMSVGATFCKFAPALYLYSTYGETFDKGSALLQKLKKSNGEFRKFLERQRRLHSDVVSLDLLDALLISPIQRLPRYNLLLSDLLRNTPEDDPEHAELQHAVDMMLHKSEEMNESVRQSENTNKLQCLVATIVFDDEKVKEDVALVRPGRRLVAEAECTVLDTRAGSDKSDKKMPAHLFLFNDLLVITKRKRMSAFYLFKHALPLTALSSGVIADQPARFFVYRDGEPFCTVVMQTKDESETWVSTLEETRLRRLEEEEQQQAAAAAAAASASAAAAHHPESAMPRASAPVSLSLGCDIAPMPMLTYAHAQQQPPQLQPQMQQQLAALPLQKPPPLPPSQQPQPQPQPQPQQPPGPPKPVRPKPTTVHPVPPVSGSVVAVRPRPAPAPPVAALDGTAAPPLPQQAQGQAPPRPPRSPAVTVTAPQPVPGAAAQITGAGAAGAGAAGTPGAGAAKPVSISGCPLPVPRRPLPQPRPGTYLAQPPLPKPRTRSSAPPPSPAVRQAAESTVRPLAQNHEHQAFQQQLQQQLEAQLRQHR